MRLVMFLLKMSPVLGLLIAALLSVALTALLFIIAHMIFRGKRPKEIKHFVAQTALRLGTMHALVVALVFSILTGELIKLQSMSDVEAISAANVYWILVDNPSEEGAQLQELLPRYLQTVIEQDWQELSGKPHNLPAWDLIGQMQRITLKWNPATPSDQMIKGYVFNNLNTMAENRSNRVIERQAPDLPTIFWVIAILGYFLTLMPFLMVELSRRRLFLISCYAIMIGILFYGIVLLDNPFTAKTLKPSSFEVMYNEIKEGSPPLSNVK